MTMQAAEGSFAMSTTLNATGQITGLGFTPRVLLFKMTGLTSMPSNTSGATALHGWAALNGGVIQQAAVGGVSQDNQTTSNIHGAVSGNACLFRLSTTGTLDAAISIDSFDADGFTWKQINAASSGFIVLFLALGGNSLTDAAAGVVAMPGSTGNFAITGMGFQPDAMLFLGAGHSATVSHDAVTSPTDVEGNGFNLGFATSPTVRRALAWAGETGNVAGSNVRSLMSATKCLSMPTHNANTVDTSLDLVSFDTGGCTLNKVAGAAATRFAWLALKGGNYKIGDTAMRTDTADQVVTGLGFDPVALFLSGIKATAASDTPIDHTNLILGFGVSETAQGRIGCHETDALATTDATLDIDNATIAKHRDRTGANTFVDAGSAALKTLDADGFTLDQVTAAGSAWLLPYLAFGPASGGGGGPTVNSIVDEEVNQQIMYQRDYLAERRRVLVRLVDDTDGFTPEIAETGGQPKISKNGAAFANTTAVLAAVSAADGLYYVELTQAEVDSLGSARIYYKSAATRRFSVALPVEECPWIHDGLPTAATATTITLQSPGPVSVPPGSIVRIVAGTGEGQTAVVLSYVSGTRVATMDQTAWPLATPDTTSRYVILPGLPLIVPKVDATLINSSAEAAQRLQEGLETVSAGAIAASPASTTTSLQTNLALQATGYYRGFVRFKGGALDAQSAKITSSATSGANTVLTLDAAYTLTAAPVAGQAFVVS